MTAAPFTGTGTAADPLGVEDPEPGFGDPDAS
jgi:hypothetical protein